MVDSHFHLADFNDSEYKKFVDFSKKLGKSGKSYFYCTCAGSREEFILQKERNEFNKENGVLAFGLHPWHAQKYAGDFDFYSSYLEDLCKSRAISCIGECGFDFYTKELKSFSLEQEKCFLFCLELSIRYRLPMVIHLRKALFLIFKYADLLKDSPGVLFHSFSFGAKEAHSILSKNINAYFSFGNVLALGSKKAYDAVSSLPVERILLETDAPYNRKKEIQHENFLDIYNTTECFSKIKNISLGDSSLILDSNFKKLFLDDVTC